MSTETKHTPGPWYTFESTVYKDVGNNRHPVAIVTDWSEETWPNMKLIAAAPELLEALKFMRSNYANTDWPSDQIAREKMDAAIQKAEARE